MKRITMVLAILAVTTGAILIAASSARSDVIVYDDDSYAAIAYSPATGKYGFAYNYGSRWAAESAALANCKADDARIVTWVNNGFCALALGDDKSTWGVGWSYGDGASNAEARNYALSQCCDRTTNCRIVLCVCSTDIDPEVNP